MEPQVQYAQTEDGVSIAFSTLGDGMPLVVMPALPFGHIQSASLQFRMWVERLAKNRMVVVYDNRGCGLSDREVTDFSLQAHLHDLRAVVECLGLERFDLMGRAESGPAAIAHAARQPEPVSHLILWSTWANAADVWSGSRYPALHALRQSDWELYVETVAAMLGLPTREEVQAAAAVFRESVAEDVATAFWEAAQEFDVTALLPDVKAPALVLHPARVPWISVDFARRLAARIPNARLTILDSGPAPLGEEAEVFATAIEDFLREGDAVPRELPEGMAVLLFADIAESTALTERLGDAAFRAKASELDTSLRDAIRESGGTPVEGKVLGDGVLAVFASARQAIDCALRCNAAGDSAGLQLHLGIHAGDVIREGNNVYGGAVNIAARIAGASAPGEVLVSDILRGLARTSAGVSFDDRGEHELKGVGDPQRLFAVRGQPNG